MSLEVRAKSMLLACLGLLASFAIVSCSAEGKTGSFLAYEATIKEGSIPNGFQKAGDVVVYTDGRIQVFGSKLSLHGIAPWELLKSLPETPGWHYGQLSPAQLQALKQSIDSTNFDSLDIDKNARPSSESDGSDVVAEFHQGWRTFNINLWQLRQRQSLKPLKLMEDYRKTAFSSPVNNKSE